MILKRRFYPDRGMEDQTFKDRKYRIERKMTGEINLKEESILFRKMNHKIPSTTYGTFALYRYPAKFIPQVIAYIFDKYGYPGMSVFDPFAGYGTVGLASKIYGYDYELWDLNPLLEIFHKVATMEAEEIYVGQVISEMKRFEGKFIPDWSNIEYWYPKDFLNFLYNIWGYYHAQDENLKLLLTIPLLKVTRYFSYDDTQRQKLSKSPKSIARINSLLANDWKNAFYEKVNREINAIIDNIKEYHKLSPKPVRSIVRGGVDSLTRQLDEEKEILITSPPYLQAQQYIRQAKMDLFWLGYREEEIKRLSKLEIPYREVDSCRIHSESYNYYRNLITEERLQKIFDQYFWGVLGALTNLQKRIRSYLFLFVGSANIRGMPIPIDRIFAEHFTALDWEHEITLKDTIVSRQLFFYIKNPATGLKDQRMRTENLLVLRRSKK